MDQITPFPRLWVEEEHCLRDQASRLREGAVVVEIGTAQGGSAYLLASSAKARQVSIYTYDLTPSNQASEILKKFDNVHIFAQPSVEGARGWPEMGGKSIDLLFIDGSHTLGDVFLDFIGWYSHIKIGGRILFHDYDPIHRGGFAHLGVKVFIDGLIKLGGLSDCEHIGRIFAGVKEKAFLNSNRLEEACVQAWNNVSEKVEAFLAFDFGNCDFIGCEADYVVLLKALRGLRGHQIKDWKEAEPGRQVVVLPQRYPLSKDLIEKIANDPAFLLLDELTFFYLLNDSIRNNREGILAMTQNKGLYFKWEELLEMHCHAHRCEGTIRDFKIEDESISGISRVCARELVRVNMLRNLFIAIKGEVG